MKRRKVVKLTVEIIILKHTFKQITENMQTSYPNSNVIAKNATRNSAF